MIIIDYYDDLGRWQRAGAEWEREREGEDDRLDILGHVGYPKADRDLSTNGVSTGLSGQYGESFTKTCHEHHVYVLMHVIKCADQFL